MSFISIIIMYHLCIFYAFVDTFLLGLKIIVIDILQPWIAQVFWKMHGWMVYSSCCVSRFIGM